MKLAVTGGSGALGRAVTAKAVAAGHTVVAISRSEPKQLPAGATFVRADVTSSGDNDGLAAALAGVDAIIDATNNSGPGAHAVLVDGTRRLLDAAKAAGVGHFVGISIVGIDGSPYPYYQVKVAQERVIEASPIPWTLLRATQFHELVPMLIARTVKLGIVFAPRGWSLQPIDTREVAAELVALASKQPQQRVADIGGPEVIDFAVLARKWKASRKVSRWVLRVPVPGALGRFFRSGAMCCPERAIGTLTFDQWLAETYRPSAPAKH